MKDSPTDILKKEIYDLEMKIRMQSGCIEELRESETELEKENKELKENEIRLLKTVGNFSVSLDREITTKYDVTRKQN